MIERMQHKRPHARVREPKLVIKVPPTAALHHRIMPSTARSRGKPHDNLLPWRVPPQSRRARTTQLLEQHGMHTQLLRRPIDRNEL